MGLTHLSSLVFVGGHFPVGMFDERSLFGGRLDADGQLKAGPIAQFVYSDGRFRFHIGPQRIDLISSGPDVMPQEVLDAASRIAGVMEPMRSAVPFTGFGMNCDTVFELQSEGGVEFCRRLMHMEEISQLVGDVAPIALEQVRFERGSVRFTVRLEPHNDSAGRNLFVAVNGHQEVTGEELPSLLARTTEFQNYICDLHGRIVEAAGSIA